MPLRTRLEGLEGRRLPSRYPPAPSGISGHVRTILAVDAWGGQRDSSEKLLRTCARGALNRAADGPFPPCARRRDPVCEASLGGYVAVANF